MNDLCEKIMAIKRSEVPVMSQDRYIPRKEQARLARDLFKRLGIKGVSVTAQRGANLQSVDVQFPVDDAVDRRRVYEKMALILDLAFPDHIDRSDHMTDHFDFKWCINVFGPAASLPSP